MASSGADRRGTGLLLLLAAVLTPLALWAPHRTWIVDEWLLAGLARALRPFAWFGEVRAASPVAPGPSRQESEAAAAAASVRLALARDVTASREGVLVADVLAASGRGAAGWPNDLVLACLLPAADVARLAGRPVSCGDDLIGFVRPPEAGADVQRLRVELLSAVPVAGHRRRLLATARSARDAAAPELQLIVEAALEDSQHPLRVLRAMPRDVDTWSDARFPYVVRTTSSDLEPGLPAGLVLGHLEDIGYREHDYVLRRFVVPARDPRLLVQVAISGGGVTQPRDEAARTTVRVDLATPARLAHRRYLLRGSGLVAGAAIVEGARCLGRVLWARGGVAAAAPLHDTAGEHVMVWLGPSDETRTVLVRGLGAGGPDRGRFAVLAPRALDAATLVGGRLFSSGRGGVFPPDLLVGEVVDGAGKTISCAMAVTDAWPASVEVARHGGGR